MSSDIVERLRNYDDDGIKSTHWDGCVDVHYVCAILWAADEIERLRDEVAACIAARDAWHADAVGLEP